MKAQFVSENLVTFKRGEDPKRQMGLGEMKPPELVRPGDPTIDYHENKGKVLRIAKYGTEEFEDIAVDFMSEIEDMIKYGDIDDTDDLWAMEVEGEAYEGGFDMDGTASFTYGFEGAYVPNYIAESQFDRAKTPKESMELGLDRYINNLEEYEEAVINALLDKWPEKFKKYLGIDYKDIEDMITAVDKWELIEQNVHDFWENNKTIREAVDYLYGPLNTYYSASASVM